MIGGNQTMTLIKRNAGTKDARGVMTPGSQAAATLTGWLDLMTGDSRYQLQGAKARESSHVFLADWQQISAREEDLTAKVGNDLYDVMLIDDPMGMHRQLEVYLKYIGPVGVGA